jgi:hypothetical protein
LTARFNQKMTGKWELIYSSQRHEMSQDDCEDCSKVVMYKTLIFIPLYEFTMCKLIQKVPDDENMISKHTFLIIVISISKHCSILYFQSF